MLSGFRKDSVLRKLPSWFSKKFILITLLMVQVTVLWYSHLEWSTLTLTGAHPEVVEAHFGTTEAHLTVVEDPPRVAEAHCSVKEAYLGAIEAQAETTGSSPWSIRTLWNHGTLKVYFGV
jgi:hypothetical protein